MNPIGSSTTPDKGGRAAQHAFCKELERTARGFVGFGGSSSLTIMEEPPSRNLRLTTPSVSSQEK